MKDQTFLTVCTLCLWTVTLVSCGVRKFDTVSIEECVPGKYFWRESNPSEFYACLTLSKRAVKMRCGVDSYMCNTGPKVFQPCMCKGEPKHSVETQAIPKLHETSQKDMLFANMKEGRFSKFAKMATEDDESEMMAKAIDAMIAPNNDPSKALDSSAVVGKEQTSDESGTMGYYKPFDGIDNAYVRVGNAGMTPTAPTSPDTNTNSGESQFTSPDPLTTTIPDSGCPFTLEEYPGVSHPYGNNITNGLERDEAEECKYWCLIHSYCRGVDFNANTNTCYYLAQVKPALVNSGVSGVTHYRKVKCTRPLRCFTYSSEVLSPLDTAITDKNTPHTQCNGVCYTRETISLTSNTIERGCMTSSVPVSLGCKLSDNYMSITCFCNTMRCNGLSIHAMASQLLHMPLDDDMSDHSGGNHIASVPDGYSGPDFQCLDKSINCSALFTGNQCVKVSTVTGRELGVYQTGDSTFSPEATFSVFFKRITQPGGGTKGGIFGNSESPAVQPTWQLSNRAFANFISAGVISEATQLESLEDYEFIGAKNDEWHMALMTYEGLFDYPNHRFPKVVLYVDGKAVDGNSGLEKGAIDINSSPVTIGCIAGNNFFGYIDDARIFVTALSQEDIQALYVMRDSNYWQ